MDFLGPVASDKSARRQLLLSSEGIGALKKTELLTYSYIYGHPALEADEKINSRQAPKYGTGLWTNVLPVLFDVTATPNTGNVAASGSRVNPEAEGWVLSYEYIHLLIKSHAVSGPHSGV